MKAIIHASPIRWQQRYLKFFANGFAKHGISSEWVSYDKPKNGDIHVLLGPNYWKNCERIYSDTNTDFLQVNRKFLGDVNDDVTISWNGFNGRGQFCVDQIDPHVAGAALRKLTLLPWKSANPNRRALILGQADLGRCTEWKTLDAWYHDVKIGYDIPYVFRKWPGDRNLQADVARTLFSVTLNSTVAIETLILGHPTVAHDEGSPVFAWCNPQFMLTEPPRLNIIGYLAMCDYHHTDIELGLFWEQLNPRRGPRLCDVEF
jgi:hypothetical protein